MTTDTVSCILILCLEIIDLLRELMGETHKGLT